VTHDLVIRGGTVVDGTGAPVFRADVAVDGGRIAAVGVVAGRGREEIDADGAIVTPGFVDLHTHYDGQATWDGDLLPSTAHGVTTAVLGSCGIGFAPARPEHHDRLVALMEGVEDIPGTALSEGLPWNWTSFPEYLDALAGMPRAADVLAQVPHDALRVFVMGERAFAGSEATEDDVARMAALVGDALAAGAAGFTTGRTDNHRASDGSFTPASEASRRELAGIAAAVEAAGHGVLQAVSDFDMAKGFTRFDDELAALIAMAEAAPSRRMSMSLLQRDPAPGQWKKILAGVDAAAARGLDVRVQVAPRAVGVLLGLEATFHPFMGFPTYKAHAHLPLTERVARLRVPEVKAAVLSEKSTSVAGDGSAIPRMVDDLLGAIALLSMRMFRLGDPPDYEPGFDKSLFAEAQARGVTPLEALYDALLEDDGKALLYFPLYNYINNNLDDVRAMLGHPRSLVGLGDGGAHVGTICDASFSTMLLSYWARDRVKDRLTVEDAVRRMTSVNAEFIGLSDRGTVAVGRRADLNVIDLSRLRLRRPRLVADLPAGGKRFLQDAEGYRATLVAGVPTLKDDRLTGARPGRLVRLGSA
jgi:N-acyl-D-aspartate/D-glutamate deacylase